MPLSREEKEQAVARLAEAFSGAQAAFMTDFRGLSVGEMSALRHRLHQLGARYMVVKNALARLALEQAGLSYEDDLFAGPTAVALTREELVATAKALVDFGRETPSLTIRGGMLEGRKLSAAEVVRLAALPPLPELRARLVGTISAPPQALVGLMAGGPRGLLGVVRGRIERLEQAA